MNKHFTLALDVMQAALSLAMKRMLEGPEAVTDAEIERAAELFEVDPEYADQIMLVYEMLVAFGDSVRTAEIPTKPGLKR